MRVLTRWAHATRGRDDLEYETRGGKFLSYFTHHARAISRAAAIGHAAVIRHWAVHTNHRAGVLQRRAREAEVEAAVEAADRFMADATARFPAGPPPPGPPPMPPPGSPPGPPPGPPPEDAGTGIGEAPPVDAHEAAAEAQGGTVLPDIGRDLDDDEEDDGDDGGSDDDNASGSEATPSEGMDDDDDGGGDGSGDDGDGGRWAPEGAETGTAHRGAVARAPAQRVRQSPRLAELEAGGAATATMPNNTNTEHRAGSE